MVWPKKEKNSWLLVASIVMFEGTRYIQKMLSSPFFILISFLILWSEKISNIVKPRLFNSILVYCQNSKNADLDTSWKNISKKKSRSINLYYYKTTRTTSWKKIFSLRICSRKICANDKTARGLKCVRSGAPLIKVWGHLSSKYWDPYRTDLIQRTLHDLKH